MTSPTKKAKPKLFLLQTRRLAESLEILSSALEQSLGELWSCKDWADKGKLHLLKGNLAGSKGVKKFSKLWVV